MKLMQYIKGDRSGENAHNVELEVLRDRFLSDAIEGFDGYGPGPELARDIAQMQKSIVSHQFLRRRRWLVWCIVVVVALLVSLAVYMLVLGGGVSGQESVSDHVAVRDGGGGGSEYNTEGLSITDTLRTDTLAVFQTDGDTVLNDTIHTNSIARQIASAVVREDSTAAPIVATSNTPKKETTVPVTSAVSENGALIKVLSSVSVGEGYISTPRIGFRKYDEYISRARVLPDHDKRGDITVSFRVNQFGRPSTMRIESSPSKEANAEAMRLLNGGPEWYPTGDERVSVVISLR